MCGVSLRGWRMPGLSLVLHDPEGSHYKNLKGLINQATTKMLVGAKN